MGPAAVLPSMAALPSTRASDVHTKLTYALPTAEGEGLYYSSVKGVSEAKTNIAHQDYDVVVRDIRSAPEACTLARAGFQLDGLSAPEIQWSDEEQVRPVCSTPYASQPVLREQN